ncbi:ABC transporter substrate-binding protein [Jannaschia sp. M317]|uniref:ABC transporter substrate-binding protein n=1 Tax=Jannaschia sp. M317 TaxID=2867011 RepID=UPI0021A71A64|nr:ABC transporter substrate-binding protein [Jannaschia sp. M317]UWQ17282.1 ABC transporter substrate-binding protein [Jannaschia sp. M317]
MLRLVSAASALALLTAPAFAQGTICGGISLVGDWAGGDEAASDVATATAPFDLDGQVPIAGHLVRMFTVSTAADLRIEVAAQPAGDPYISVYDAAGTEVAADDDSGGNFASRIEQGFAPGTYCLAARSYESGVTDVAVRIGLQSHAALTESLPTAPDPQPEATGAGCGAPDTAILAAEVASGMLGMGVQATGAVADTPAWAFSLTAPTTLAVTAASDGGDPLIRLLDDSGNVLAENDDFDGLNSRIEMDTPLPAGDYCIEVDDLNGDRNPITVGLEAFSAEDRRQRSLDQAEIAPTAADTVAIMDLGVIETAAVTDITATGRATWLRFDLPEGGLLLSEAISTDGLDPMIVLFDRVGRRLGENDDGPQGLDSYLASRLLPGSYLLAVRLVDDTSRGSVRVLLERYVPAR